MRRRSPAREELVDRQIGRLGALEDLAGANADQAIANPERIEVKGPDEALAGDSGLFLTWIASNRPRPRSRDVWPT